MYGCSVTLFFVFGRRERWRRESLAGAEGTHGGVLKGKGVGAPALPVYRCSPGVRGGGGASQAACGDPGCSQEGSGVTGSAVPPSRPPPYATGACRPLQPPSPRKKCRALSYRGEYFPSKAAAATR